MNVTERSDERSTKVERWATFGKWRFEEEVLYMQKKNQRKDHI